MGKKVSVVCYLEVGVDVGARRFRANEGVMGCPQFHQEAVALTALTTERLSSYLAPERLRVRHPE